MAQDDIETPIESGAPLAKKQKMILEDNESNSADLEDKAFSDAMTGIEETEHQINIIEDEQSIEICKLEQKFVAKKSPLYQKRQEFIEKIDDFWMVALLNHPQLSCLINESDEDCLKYLVKIEVDQKSKDIEDKTDNGQKFTKSLNHSIRFYFNSELNPYFENECLTKSYFQVMDEVISEGDEILWKEGKNLVEITREKSKAMALTKNGSGDNKPNDKNEEDDFEDDTVESFFAWFEDHEDAASDETGDLVKDDLWMRALHYYMSNDVEEVENEEEDMEDEVELEGDIEGIEE